MRKHVSRFSILICLIAICFIGCAKENKAKNDPVLKAYRLIDEQRTDEAIELLEREIQSNPENAEYKVVLASAYAHKAGFKVQKLVGIIGQVDKIKDLKFDFLNIKPSGNRAEDSNLYTDLVSRVFKMFSDIVGIYSSIPTVNKEGAEYLRHSIYLLDESYSYLKPHDFLYKALLEVVLFKHVLAENFIGEIGSIRVSTEDCKANFTKLNLGIVDSGKILIDILNDVGLALPNEAEKTAEISSQVSEAVSNLTLINTSLTVLDDASDLFLNRLANQYGFGKIIRCAGDTD